MVFSQISRRSGPHRTAVFCLYRALLRQSGASTLPVQSRQELRNVIRNRFRGATNELSVRRLRVNFEAGYEAIDHLDAVAAGDSESKTYLLSLLSRAPLEAKGPPPAPRSLKPKKPTPDADAEKRDVLSIFDRPLPKEKLSGKRHVPVLFNANGVPVLRLKKPQPRSLTRLITQRVIQRQKRHDLRHILAENKDLAASEDDWDNLTRHLLPRDQEPDRKLLWKRAPYESLKEVQRLISDEKNKNQAMATKMQEIVDREKELWEAERAEGRKDHRRQRRAKRNSTSEAGASAPESEGLTDQSHARQEEQITR